LIQFSAQLNKIDGGSDVVDIWLRKNGVDVVSSNTTLIVVASNEYVTTRNFILNITAGDDVELIWSSPDAGMRLFSTAAGTGPTRPATPSLILTATRVG